MATTSDVSLRAAPLDVRVRDWPNTTRMLPWLVAILVAAVYLVPIDSLTLPIPLPFDARPDRFLLLAAFGVWGLFALERAGQRRREPGEPGHRFTAPDALIVLFPLLAVLSVALNVDTLQVLGEAGPAVKRLVLLFSYVAFYLLVVCALRPTEVPAMVQFVVGLAVLAALGTVLEYATGYNAFYSATSLLSPPGTDLNSAEGLLAPSGRPDVTGPARHGLAVSTMLAMTLPLALVGAGFSESPRHRTLYRIAALVIFVGALATIRRSGVVLPFVASSAVIIGGGRKMLPVAVTFLVLLAAAPFALPSAFSELASQFSTSNASAQQSISGRTNDYAEIGPDVRSRALLGRGFGTYDAKRYRFLDNQYLGLLLGMGVLGTLMYVVMILAAAFASLRHRLRSKSAAGWIGLAVFGSCLAFLLANALFDTLAFPQAPYAFLLLVALASVARQGERPREGASPPAAAA